MSNGVTNGMSPGLPPQWSLVKPKPAWQSMYDLVGAPLRMILLPDHVSERLHLTSLRAERLSVVVAALEGRVLDIGAGDNALLKLYRDKTKETSAQNAAEQSVGLDVVDWGGDCTIVENCRELPFDDGSFDTVTLIACLNHIPERNETLREAFRVLRPGGKIIVTMIGRVIGEVGHAIWWYSEDKHREIQEGEVMGMAPQHVTDLLHTSRFVDVKRSGFVYGLNHLFIGKRADSETVEA